MKLGPDIAAIVTGGASGLGYATATALRDAGVQVALFDKNTELGPERAAAIGATFCAVDVMDHASVEAGFAQARAANGQERILVNCAGGGFGAFKTAGRDKQTRAIAPYPVDRFDLTVQLNLIGTFRCIALATAGMLTLEPIEGERGAIVNTASAAAEDGQMGQVAYAAA
jgi:NAD(P)-dependent dehydrogenase (short-subunit alcohol dehydrogenase family)